MQFLYANIWVSTFFQRKEIFLVFCLDIALFTKTELKKRVKKFYYFLAWAMF